MVGLAEEEVDSAEEGIPTGATLPNAYKQLQWAAKGAVRPVAVFGGAVIHERRVQITHTGVKRPPRREFDED